MVAISENIYSFAIALVGSGFGAFFAYKFNLRQQNIIDKRKKYEEQQDLNEKKSVIFSYLMIYLRMQLSNLMRIEKYISQQEEVYKKIVTKQELNKKEQLAKNALCLGYKINMVDNYADLKFTSNFPPLLGTAMMFSTEYNLLEKLVEKYNENVDGYAALRYKNANTIHQSCFSLAYYIYIIVKLTAQYNKDFLNISYADIDYSPQQRIFLAKAIKIERMKKKEEN